LDVSIEQARRDAKEQVPKRLACDVAVAISDWLRISFAVFLSSETIPLMGLRSLGEFKHYAFERFRSILHITVKNSLKTRSPIPDWATRTLKSFTPFGPLCALHPLQLRVGPLTWIAHVVYRASGAVLERNAAVTEHRAPRCKPRVHADISCTRIRHTATRSAGSPHRNFVSNVPFFLAKRLFPVLDAWVKPRILLEIGLLRSSSRCILRQS
jgi:hypothetical protein